MNNEYFNEGYNDYMEGMTVCPYVSGTFAASKWWDGWDLAASEDENGGWDYWTRNE